MSKKKVLKQKDLAAYRNAKYHEQAGMCAICTYYMEPEEAVLDHCHETGHCRGVAHRNCNGQEGRVKAQAARSGKGWKHFVSCLNDYWDKDYSNNMIHPKHLSAEQKEMKRIRKTMKALKTDKAKPKYQAKLVALQTEHERKYTNDY